MKTALIFALLTGAFVTITCRADTLPPIQGKLPMEPGAPFQFGERKHGIRIGVSTGAAEYHLNHRINVWTCLETEKHFPDGHDLLTGDPLYDHSFLLITMPDGTTAKVGTGGPLDGLPGVGSMGGCSDRLHSVIRKPGIYKLQWKAADLESGVITFTVVP